MSDATAALGTLLKLGDGGGPETFTTIAEITNIGGPSLAQDPIEVTSHSSTSGWKEFVGGLKDGGEVSLEMNFLPANATQAYGTGVLDDLYNGVLRNFQLVFPDTANTTWAFAALVTAFEVAAPVDGKLGVTATLKLSGQPTLA